MDTGFVTGDIGFAGYTRLVTHELETHIRPPAPACSSEHVGCNAECRGWDRGARTRVRLSWGCLMGGVVLGVLIYYSGLEQLVYYSGLEQLVYYGGLKQLVVG